jgi:hypothetical protein
MAKKATKRRAWAPEHVRTLKVLARKKTHAARIAKTLKRSEGATRQKAFSMGLSRTRGFEFALSTDALIQTSPANCGAFYAMPSRNMADNMFDRCTEHGLKLSFTTQAQRTHNA